MSTRAQKRHDPRDLISANGGSIVFEALCRTAGGLFAHPTEEEFSDFQQLIEEATGIHLTDNKRALLVSRLFKRMRALDLRAFRDYYRVVQTDPYECSRMIDAICTNETHFFREIAQFHYLRETVFPQWKERARSRTIRVWSAGCSTGEEPYSLAMVLIDAFPKEDGWEVEIHATDLSSRVLEQAKRGVWPVSRSAEIPEAWLSRYMFRGIGTRQGELIAGNALRSVISFGRLNLMDEAWPLPVYDLVFCRNVMIYFKPAMRTKVVSHLLEHLDPAGYLFLGHSESLQGHDELRRVAPNVYAR